MPRCSDDARAAKVLGNSGGDLEEAPHAMQEWELSRVSVVSPKSGSLPTAGCKSTRCTLRDVVARSISGEQRRSDDFYRVERMLK